MHTLRSTPPRGITRPPPCSKLRIFRTFTLLKKHEQTGTSQPEPPEATQSPDVDMADLDVEQSSCMHGMHYGGTACVAAARSVVASRVSGGVAMGAAEVWELAMAVASGAAMQIEHAAHCSGSRTEALDIVRPCGKLFSAVELSIERFRTALVDCTMLSPFYSGCARL